MKNNKICIIGGLGFVGRNLIDKLDLSNQITILGIGNRPRFLNERIDYINVKIERYKILNDQKFDYIFYLVGNASVARSYKNPLFDIDKNTIQLLYILEIIKQNESKFIFTSTAACYGEMNNPLTAYMNKPISPYGISKLFSEYYLKLYNSVYNTPILICRFYSLFGEYNNKQVVYDTTLRLLNHPEEIVVYNPNSRRDFVYVKEAINAMLFLCEKNQFNAEIFDIGRGKSMSIAELTKKIEDILNVTPIIKTSLIELKGDPKVQIADIKKLKKLGFKFRTSTKNNLAKTINWIENMK